MRGIGKSDLTPAQEASAKTSLEDLALEQLKKLSQHLQVRLGWYAEPKEMQLAKKQMIALEEATDSYSKGMFLDCIEEACVGLDVKAA